MSNDSRKRALTRRRAPRRSRSRIGRGSSMCEPRLGADVPFCMRGGFPRIRGIGDELEPSDPPALAIGIATPRFSCSTAAVYRAWDELGGPHHEINDLQAAGEHVEPRLVDFKRRV